MGDALKLTRRGLGGLAAATALAGPVRAQGRGTPVRVGLMLPYSGTFAQLGESITAAFEMHLAERGGQLGGRPVTIVRLDDASDPAAAGKAVGAELNLSPADAQAQLAQGVFLKPADLASPEWLGTEGKVGKLADNLVSAAEFLKSQQKIDAVPTLDAVQKSIYVKGLPSVLG